MLYLRAPTAILLRVSLTDWSFGVHTFAGRNRLRPSFMLTARVSTPLLDVSSRRIIAGSRVLIAVGSLVTIYFHPDQSTNETAACALSATYVLFSLALLSAVHRPTRNTWDLLLHGL